MVKLILQRFNKGAKTETKKKGMKKTILILLVALLYKAATCLAQVQNPNFEKLNADGSICNWGNVYLFSVSIDSNGVSSTDSIIFDQQFYARSTDAYIGSSALELRNAWNYTTNEGIAGAVGSDDDSVFSAWGLMNLVATNATQFSPFTPFNFGFYYKYFPVNGDSAYAEISLWDSTGNQLGQGLLLLSDSVPIYTLAVAPINYTSSGLASFYSLSIHNFYTALPGYRQPSLGTRLLVDNLGFNFVSLSSEAHLTDSDLFKIYPSITQAEVNVCVSNKEFYQIEIFNLSGQCIKKISNESKINVSDLPDGLYNVKVTQGEKVQSRKFVKRQ